MITDLKQIMVSSYNNFLIKRLFDFGLSVIIFISLIPLLLTIVVLIKIFSCPSIFFIQKRMGKNGKVFKMVKFRTMKRGSEKQRWRYLGLNEADGPVFKIRNDPRFTKFGRILSRTGLDELPQLINVIKGEMSMVGPRPLPVYEYKKLSKDQKVRNLIKPGITSLWVIEGSHNLTFDQWMDLDRRYLEEASIFMDVGIILKTLLIPLRALMDLA